ncbi:hypothetical protein ACS0TY_000684 [Phlomoides rotata]
MWRDKSPGLKILWIWTFGTAAVLVASVARTRIRDMDQFLNAAAENPAISDDSGSPESVEVIEDEKP